MILKNTNDKNLFTKAINKLEIELFLKPTKYNYEKLVRLRKIKVVLTIAFVKFHTACITIKSKTRRDW